MENVLSVWGQRPYHLRPEQRDLARAKASVATDWFDQAGVRKLICGGAPGPELWMADAAIDLGWSVEIVRAYRTEHHARSWDAADRAHHVRVCHAAGLVSWVTHEDSTDRIAAFEARSAELLTRGTHYLFFSNGIRSGATWNAICRAIGRHRPGAIVHLGVGRVASFRDGAELAPLVGMEADSDAA